MFLTFLIILILLFECTYYIYIINANKQENIVSSLDFYDSLDFPEIEWDISTNSNIKIK